MQATFADLANFLGYIHMSRDRFHELRPRIEHDLVFRGEDDPTVIVPPSVLPVGLLFWDSVARGFRVETIAPDEEQYR